MKNFISNVLNGEWKNEGQCYTNGKARLKLGFPGDWPNDERRIKSIHVSNFYAGTLMMIAEFKSGDHTLILQDISETYECKKTTPAILSVASAFAIENNCAMFYNTRLNFKIEL